MVYRSRMPYRRRYVRKYTGVRRKSYGKRIARMRKPTRRAVVHIMNRRTETKMMYNLYTSNPLFSPLDPQEVELLSPMLNGSGSNQRIGDVINLANIKIKYRWTTNGVLARDFSYKVQPYNLWRPQPAGEDRNAY